MSMQSSVPAGSSISIELEEIQQFLASPQKGDQF